MPLLDVENALRRLVDEADVAQVVLRYAQAVDTRDWPAMHACFDPDGHIIGTFGEGRMADYLPRLAERVEKFSRTMHVMANQLRTVDGDTATTETYGVAYHFVGDAEALVVGVRYSDRLVRHAGAWRIHHRRAHTIWERRDGESTS